ncbi:MAG: hypothetical protein ACKVJG_01780 [Candidatus Latescibacterota bacterium]|jgi:YbbR domain-containing protein
MKIGDWGIKAGAVGLALFLWFHAVTEHSYEKEINVRLLIEDPLLIDTSQFTAIIANEVPQYVGVLASGSGKELLQLSRDDFVLRVKTEGEASTKRTYRLQLSHIEKRAADINVQIEEILHPKELEIEFDRRVEKDLPVRSNAHLQIAQAHVQVGSLYTEPKSVRIIGPKRVLDTMHFVAANSLSMSDVRGDIDETVALFIDKCPRCVVNPNNVRVLASIQILAENNITSVPVEIRNGSGRLIRADPEFVVVKVRGGVDVISNINALKDLDLFVDFKDFQDGDFSVQKPNYENFEVLEIIPSQINVVSR